MFIPFPKSPHNIPLYALIPFHETLRFNFLFWHLFPIEFIFSCPASHGSGSHSCIWLAYCGLLIKDN